MEALDGQIPKGTVFSRNSRSRSLLEAEICEHLDPTQVHHKQKPSFPEDLSCVIYCVRCEAKSCQTKLSFLDRVSALQSRGCILVYLNNAWVCLGGPGGLDAPGCCGHVWTTFSNSSSEREEEMQILRN